MIKKLIIFTLAIMCTLIFASCKEEPAKEPEAELSNESVASSPIIYEEDVEDAVEEEATLKNEIKKPQSTEEIISLADSFNVNTGLTEFTLDGILDEVQLSLTEDAGEDYQNTTAYLGDSVSLGLGVFGNHPKELVIAKGSINPMDAVDKLLYELDDGTLVNFPDALSRLDVKRAVLTFGANAISIMSEETFLNYYTKLIRDIKKTSPECEIIIQSISPIATTCTLKKFTNVLINRANLLLLILAYSEDLHFLNSAPALKGDDGYLKLEYCSSDDGIHINQSGYEIWIDFLKTHALADE